MLRTKGKHAGFTLVEMVFTLTITAVLVSVTVWQLSPAVARAKVRRTASVIAGDLQYAQLMAARDREPVVFLVVPGQQYVIRNRAEPDSIYRRRWIGPNTDYASDALVSLPSGALEIFPNGMTRATTTITVSTGSYTRSVKITLAGQIRIVP